MNNYKLTIQYDGGRYKGWQRLGNGENTIQGKIEAVLTELAGRPIEIIGCSRTDAGVHAYAQIANVKLNVKLSEAEIKNYLNKYLPQDISVTEVALVPERFHARYNAKDKTYLYKIWNEDYTNPFMRKYSMHVEKKLDITNMKKAAQAFIGEHDFTAYSNAKSKKKTMVREIHALEIEERSGFIYIRVSGNGFLYNMVRKMVGTLIEVGLGQIEAEMIPTILASKERNQTGLIAEPAGLHLEGINF
ncbi:MAG: tRNA pseudouridine(38-40) synthase TruA [Anaerobacillus sp.]|uniref:tRNA pseudouridine(38-40) synthase TruA n=1 Tax=Anaerobacillus sp. TaxID=1872506 RepID=UPI00391C65F3